MAPVLEWTGILLMGLARNGAGFDIALGAEARSTPSRFGRAVSALPCCPREAGTRPYG
ncbi:MULTISPECIES: hypothetical protein [Streptacidiphilus]|uniref:Uncharacterized protein n=1 Tax=Streptacidiphilus cavernicola TaxID=3342716 RepID=A0ABV6UL98_9ACTN|nr:hypothetical protein [Streptacidiphilus jeojiense]